jgi:hypothetical protein
MASNDSSRGRTGVELTEQELKLTAALYAKRGAADHVKRTGKLPQSIGTGGMHIGMRLLIEERGRDITLTLEEQLVYDAIKRERRLPGGSVRLVPREAEETQ